MCFKMVVIEDLRFNTLAIEWGHYLSFIAYEAWYYNATTVVPTNGDSDVIFVYNCKVNINLYYPLARTRIDRSRVY